MDNIEKYIELYTKEVEHIKEYEILSDEEKIKFANENLTFVKHYSHIKPMLDRLGYDGYIKERAESTYNQIKEIMR